MSELIEKETVKQQLKQPAKWNVIFLNDDFTTFEFVMACLTQIFNKSAEEAEKITVDVHKNGKAIVGSYIKDIAITKQTLAMDAAKQHGHPLQVLAEPGA